MRVPVWGVVESLRLGAPDDEVLRALPALTVDDLQVARRYYEEHREESTPPFVGTKRREYGASLRR
jgi:uncharacterized protein (DUF433 family)